MTNQNVQWHVFWMSQLRWILFDISHICTAWCQCDVPCETAVLVACGTNGHTHCIWMASHQCAPPKTKKLQGERFYLSIYQPNSFCSPGKISVTRLTAPYWLIRWPSCVWMSYHVRFESRLHRKRLATDFAHKWFFTCVCSHVIPKSRRSCELLRT